MRSVKTKKSVGSQYINLSSSGVGDEFDSRINLYSEEAFQHGITFHAKLVGTSEVPRPSSRVEIVAAMRKIRYDCKVKSVKKRKVTITVSMEGVKVHLAERRKTPSMITLMHYPVHR